MILEYSINNNRKDTWVDIHNLRALKYGGFIHIDCHLTLPWYFNLKEAHDEIDVLMDVINEEFADTIEMFVHTDWCYESSCRISSQ